MVSTADAIQLIREGGRLRVEDAPSVKPKFVDQVEHRTFSGTLAARRGQPVLYVTERCVFELRVDGLALTEIAPGADLERNILAHMGFRPRWSRCHVSWTRASPTNRWPCATSC